MQCINYTEGIRRKNVSSKGKTAIFSKSILVKIRGGKFEENNKKCKKDSRSLASPSKVSDMERPKTKIKQQAGL